LQQNYPSRNPHLSISEALAAARAAAYVPAWPSIRGEDVGRSLAEMAQRDLDAALQLLADRAQFITGASGAAIALRREGMKDMLCRASTGSNAPELGARLSTEFGLSGESVRTKQLLRCDDAERDARVNRDVCRQLGIASVVVMPVVHDDQVLGVFELFSGKTNAFGERDLSAMQRLGSMVETAVRMAQVTERLPETLKADPNPAPQPEIAVSQEQVDEEILDLEGDQSPQQLSAVLDAPKQPPEPDPASHPEALTAGPAPSTTAPLAGASELPNKPPTQMAPFSPNLGQAAHPFDVTAPRKPLLWSAVESEINADRSADNDQSHVPPVLRGLRKCEACGFPISGGRVLCVECEEKKWRGQLKRSNPMPTGAIPGNSIEKPRALAVAAPGQSGAGFATAPAMNPPSPNVTYGTKVSESLIGRSQTTLVPAPAELRIPEATAPQAAPNFVFGAGLEDSPSWISANKYVVGALVLVTIVISAFFLLR
jgi:GAF domain